MNLECLTRERKKEKKENAAERIVPADSCKCILVHRQFQTICSFGRYHLFTYVDIVYLAVIGITLLTYAYFLSEHPSYHK